MKNIEDYNKVLSETLNHSIEYLTGLNDMPVNATRGLNDLRSSLAKNLNNNEMKPEEVINELIQDVNGGLLSSTGSRFFAWVIGGSLPAALAADWLTSTWDQNAALFACSPAEAVIEEVAGQWLKELLRLPNESSFALTTGCQMAHVTCLAAARNKMLQDHSWDVEKKGLSGAPQIHILTNSQLHASVERAARFLGLGSDSIVPLEIDCKGQLKAEVLEKSLENHKGKPVIVQLCAGDINTGAYDNFEEIIPIAHKYNAWVHVDGAFGLWVNASPKYRYLLKGVELADSWATDGHKWLNVPYDCGYAFIKHSEYHKSSMSMRASYLTHDEDARDQFDWNPEWSRRGRGVSTYAAIRQLGKKGVAGLIDSSCESALSLVKGIGELQGASIMSLPQINQGLIRFECPKEQATEADHDRFTDMVIEGINNTGKLFVGGTNWNNKRCMRISVCGWLTDDEDIQLSVSTISMVLDDLVKGYQEFESRDSSKL